MPKRPAKPKKKKKPKPKAPRYETTSLSGGLDDYYAAMRQISRKEKRKRILGGHNPSCWPMRSDALSVHPRQVGQAYERARKLGVPTEFHPSGDPIFTSRGHRAAYMKYVETGVYDRDGGYGDAQRGPSRSGRTDQGSMADFGERL